MYTSLAIENNIDEMILRASTLQLQKKLILKKIDSRSPTPYKGVVEESFDKGK